MTSGPIVDAGSSVVIVEPAAARPSRSLRGAIAGMPPQVGGVIGVVVIVLVWELVSLTPFGRDGAIPSPLSVGLLFVQAVQSPGYWDGVLATTVAAAEGYVVGVAVALLIAFVVLLLPRSEGIATQLAVVTSCLPLTAIGPLAVIMSPAESRFASVLLAGLSVVFTTVVGSILGLKSASGTQLDVITAYGGTRLTQITKVRLISGVPSLLAALKIAAPAAFLGAVLGEYFLVGVDNGVGILLLRAQFDNDAPQVWTLALTSGAVAGLAYFLIDRIGRLVAPWSVGDRKKAAF